MCCRVDEYISLELFYFVNLISSCSLSLIVSDSACILVAMSGLYPSASANIYRRPVPNNNTSGRHLCRCKIASVFATAVAKSLRSASLQLATFAFCIDRLLKLSKRGTAAISVTQLLQRTSVTCSFRRQWPTTAHVSIAADVSHLLHQLQWPTAAGVNDLLQQTSVSYCKT